MTVRQRIQDFLNAFPYSKVTEISAGTKISESVTRKAIRKMEYDGVVRAVRRHIEGKNVPIITFKEYRLIDQARFAHIER